MLRVNGLCQIRILPRKLNIGHVAIVVWRVRLIGNAIGVCFDSLSQKVIWKRPNLSTPPKSKLPSSVASSQGSTLPSPTGASPSASSTSSGSLSPPSSSSVFPSTRVILEPEPSKFNLTQTIYLCRPLYSKTRRHQFSYWPRQLLLSCSRDLQAR